MDGVIANFDKALEGHIDRMFERGFFRNLEPIGTPNEVFSLLQSLGYNVNILTTAVRTEYCAYEKVQWLREHCPSIDLNHIHIIYTGESKADNCPTDITDSILVDDYKANLSDWQSKGGTSIKFGNKWKVTRPYLQVIS